MKVKWGVSDDSDHYTEIPDDELADCADIEAREKLIWEYVDHDFEQFVCPVIDGGCNEWAIKDGIADVTKGVDE